MPLIASAPLGSSSWLLRLRTFAIVGQLLTILAAQSLTRASLPMWPLLSLLALTATTNLVYGWWLSSRPQSQSSHDDPSQRVAFSLMALDLITLTAMLYFTGGADNPFSFFYFVNLAVGGVMLRVSAVWTLSALAMLGYAVLLITSVPVAGLTVQTIDGPSSMDRPSWLIAEISIRETGLLLAFAACVAVVTFFVTQTTRQLRDREEDLRRTEAERADAARLEGLTTLAAGAAHELATPLSAIDVACRELTRHLDGIEKPESINEDLRLIDGQLLMCRQILARMRSASGDAAADQWNRTTLGELIDTTLEGIRDPHRVDIEDESATWESQRLFLPEEAVAQSIRNLIHNALDASDPLERVVVTPLVHGDHVTLDIVDRGSGMSDEVLERAGDPFFTTKEPGRGIGLGLFLTRNVITRLGGTLQFDSQPGRGTRARVTLPVTEQVPRPRPSNA